MASINKQKIIIKNESEAFQYLEKALLGEFSGDVSNLSFDRWPLITIRLKGDGYNSTITSDIAESLVQLQQALNRAYAREVKKTTNARALSGEEKKSIKFKAKIKNGSSLIEINLGDFSQKLISALVDKMDPQQLVITILGLGLIGGGVVAYRSFLKHRSEEVKVQLEAQSRIALSKEETRRNEILVKAITAKPQLGFAQQDFDDVRREVLKSAGDAETITVQGFELTNQDARRIAATPRTESEEVQLNGHYLIQKIDWTQSTEVRLWLSSTDESLEFIATLKGSSLTEDLRSKLQASEWDRKRIHMSINGTRLRGEITTASIISVDWPKDKKLN